MLTPDAPVLTASALNLQQWSQVPLSSYELRKPRSFSGLSCGTTKQLLLSAVFVKCFVKKKDLCVEKCNFSK